MAQRLILHSTLKAQGDTDTDAPYGWVEGIANANVSDRYDELVLPSAMADAALKFMLNPVMSFGHGIEGNPSNGTLPAGSVLKMWQDQKGDTHFRARWANTEDAQKVRGLYKDGDMRGFSVQFITLDSRKPSPEELAKFPKLRNVITQLDLIEIACAVVPVNQGSLATAAKSLASIRKLALPQEGETMDKRAFTPEEMKQVEGLVANYNSLAESMATTAAAIEDIQAKAPTEADHGPMMKTLLDSHTGMGTNVKGMGETCLALCKGFGVAPEAAAEPDPAADPAEDDTEDPEEITPEQEKSFLKAFTQSLKGC